MFKSYTLHFNTTAAQGKVQGLESLFHQLFVFKGSNRICSTVAPLQMSPDVQTNQ